MKIVEPLCFSHIIYLYYKIKKNLPSTVKQEKPWVFQLCETTHTVSLGFFKRRVPANMPRPCWAPGTAPSCPHSAEQTRTTNNGPTRGQHRTTVPLPWATEQTLQPRGIFPVRKRHFFVSLCGVYRRLPGEDSGLPTSDRREHNLAFHRLSTDYLCASISNVLGEKFPQITIWLTLFSS